MTDQKKVTSSGADWDRIESLWSKAAGLPREERADWLDSACRGDHELRRELEDLLQADRQDEDRFELLIERLAVDLVGNAKDTSAPALVEAPVARAAPFPDRIGRIRVEERLGEGGMGIVYRGTDEALHRKVAIKAIRGHVDDPARQRLRREAMMLSSLEHPNICRLYDFVHHRGADYLILELIDGQTLGELLREQGKPSRDRGLAIAQVIAEVLDLASREPGQPSHPGGAALGLANLG